MIHFFIRKREGALSRYSEPSRRLQGQREEGRMTECGGNIRQPTTAAAKRLGVAALVYSYRSLKQLGFLV